MNKDLISKIEKASVVISAVMPTENIYDITCQMLIREFKIDMVWLGIIKLNGEEPAPISGESSEEFVERVISFVWGFLSNDPTGMGMEKIDGVAVDALKAPDEKLLILDQGSLWVINDVETFAYYPKWRKTALTLGFKSAAGLPMISFKGNLIGVVHIYSKTPHFFSEEELTILQTFSNLAASAIEVRQLIDDYESALHKKASEIKQEKDNLERMNKLFVGRELRMIELKDKIKELEGMIEMLKRQG